MDLVRELGRQGFGHFILNWNEKDCHLLGDCYRYRFTEKRDNSLYSETNQLFFSRETDFCGIDDVDSFLESDVFLSMKDELTSILVSAEVM